MMLKAPHSLSPAGKYYIERPSVMQRNRAASRRCGGFYFRVDAIDCNRIQRQIPT
jgi:hypothetical protein